MTQIYRDRQVQDEENLEIPQNHKQIIKVS